MILRKVLIARDSKAEYAPVTGLKPTWVHLTDADKFDQVDDKPEFHELGGGQYMVSLEARPGELFFGQVDLGPTLVSGLDRFVDVYFEHPQSQRGGGTD